MSKQDAFKILKDYPGVKFTSEHISKLLCIHPQNARRNLDKLSKDNIGVFKDAEVRKIGKRVYAVHIYWFSKKRDKNGATGNN